MEDSIQLAVARLERKIVETKTELLLWMFVLSIAQVVATVALIKLIK